MVPMPERVGGRLCLDLVNTVDPRHGAERRDFLTDYDAVLDWYESVDVALPRSVRWLRSAAIQDAAAARRAHRQLVVLRESLHTVITAAVAGEQVQSRDLTPLNDALGVGIGHRLLAPAERGGVRETWRTEDALEQVSWPVAIDAWDLLTEPELTRVRACPVDAGGCGWLFLDLSRSGNRRWCDMRTCGNRAKVRAHYARSTR